MFVQSARFIENHSGNINRISVYGQDSNPTTWKLAQMNLAIRGIDADLGKFSADTFFNDCHPQLKADFIMANPPFNLSNWGADKLREDVREKKKIRICVSLAAGGRALDLRHSSCRERKLCLAPAHDLALGPRWANWNGAGEWLVVLPVRR